MKALTINKVLLYILALLFLASGILHLVRPEVFLWLMPPWLPQQIPLILISGVFELICAVGLLFRQKWAGYLSALVLLGVWPANIWYAFDVSNQGYSWLVLVAWVRLPLQIPFIYAALKFSRD